MRTLHLNNQEWKYQIGREFVKAVSPVGKVHLIKIGELTPKSVHNCDEFMDEMGKHYEYQCGMCLHESQVTPGKIKAHLLKLK